MTKVEVQARGIKNRLKNVKPYKALAEYIWNGFDAGANTIQLDYSCNALGTVENISVEDNGSGIPFELVDNKFTPVLSSEKRDEEKQHSLLHGKNGLGRLTFYHFSQKAHWRTVYQKNDELHSFTIDVDQSNIDLYNNSATEKVHLGKTGTIVHFENVFEIAEVYVNTVLTDYLRKEFSWFLELNHSQGFEILINGVPLIWNTLIKDEETFEVNIANAMFSIRYIRWASKLNRHFSRYYCIDSAGKFKYSMPTTFNNKGDDFYHSVFIESPYFDDFVAEKSPQQGSLINSHNDQSSEFKELISTVNKILQSKRRPFIIDHARLLVDSYEKDAVFPAWRTDVPWEQMRHEDLKNAVSQLYQIDSRIFSNLNLAQKKTFVGFVGLILDKGEINDLFEILEGIVSLTLDEKQRFARQLKSTKMSSIINTIELIADRYSSVEDFKRLVFDPKMYAGEVPHLQKMMEKNYWLISEEFQLMTAAEPDFEEALRRYMYMLHGDGKKVEVAHDDKKREMDLFLVRRNKRQGKIENIVVELKHPVNVKLGKKEFDQVYAYFQVIKSEARFNGSNMDWKFVLIGNEFDTSGYVPSQIRANKHRGEPGLAFFDDTYKLYAFTWSEIFTEFELRHDFLNKSLNLELARLVDESHNDANDIVTTVRTSDAPAEFLAPVK